MKKQIQEFIAQNRQNIVDDWKALVNMEGSYRQPEAMHRIADWLCDKFRDAGVDCQVYRVRDEVPPVVAGVIGADRPGTPVIFTGHFDTVFDPDTFGPEPFRIEDGKAYGPGVLDMKGGIVIVLYVIKALEAAGFKDRPIRICFCGDEEGGKFHSYACEQFQKWADGCIAGFNMETAPINNDLCVGRKWAMGGHAVVHGVSAHSGNNYPVGRNAVVEAAYKIIAIQNLNDMEKGTNMNPAIVHGGTVGNVIPDTCTIDFSGRFLYTSEIDRVREALKKIFETPDIEGTSIEYTIGGAGGGFEDTKANRDLLAYINTVCEEEGYPSMGAVVLGGGSDAGNVAMKGVPVLCSCGVRGEWNHTDREYAVVESMYERTELWCEVVAHMDRFGK